MRRSMMRSTAVRSSPVRPRVEKRVESIEWQVQAVQQQINRFVPGVVGAVSEGQSGLR
jgi:hypothetical protein